MNKNLRDILHSAGLASLAAEIEQVALPSIRFIAQSVDEIELVLGACKLGGSPDFPPNFAWPEQQGIPLPFIAQINLSKVASYNVEHILPSSGILYFFFDVERFFDNWPRNREFWRVIYYNGNLSDLQRTLFPKAIKKYNPCNLIFSSEITLPYYDQYDPDSIKRLRLSKALTDEETLSYNNLKAQLANTAETKYHLPIHRLLGYADPVQRDVLQEIQLYDHKSLDRDILTSRDLKKGNIDYRLLMQIDSDSAPDTDWGDTGRIYYYSSIKDLVKQDFSQAGLVLQDT